MLLRLAWLLAKGRRQVQAVPQEDRGGALMSFGARTVKVMEPFQFADGTIRLAWVWWTIGDGERRAVKVEELRA